MKKTTRLLLFILLASLLALSFIPSPIVAPILYAFRIGIVLGILFVFLKPVYLTGRFYLGMGILAAFFVMSFPFPILFPLAQSALLIFFAMAFADGLVLFNKKLKIECKRKLPRLFSLGDPNPISFILENNYALGLQFSILDELPIQFQKRDFKIKRFLKGGTKETIAYDLRPVSRGEYHFYNTNVFIKSNLGLLERRIIVENQETIPVYPSVIQMKKYELIALSRISTLPGVKKMRKLGHSYEFEQIRNYVKGDDYRSINWKATGRHNMLMVNQYEDERSQQVFSVIDKGRSMKMPFEGLSLMDYAINTSLVISNVALQKHDKAGLLTFSDKIGATIKADSGSHQLRSIIEALYREKERNLEANFELLYQACRTFIRRRSLILLYTNFESHSAMERVLPILRRINHLHLLVVIFFENTEILDFSEQKASNTEEIYNKTIAQKFVQEKHRIVQELQQYGIQTILTRPENLSMNTLNKYLELKARHMI